MRAMVPRGKGRVSDMAPDEATRVQEPVPTSRGHRLVSCSPLIVCGGTFGLIFSANKIAVTGGIPIFASAIMVFPFIAGSGQW